MKYIAEMPWAIVVLVCLTLGLAPFSPPHIVEKLQMLAQGRLVRLIDWLDLLMHGAPWAVLVAKVVLTLRSRA